MHKLIEYFADNPIAANLMMIFLLIGGLSGLGSIDKEMFPSFNLDMVRVSVAYPGAGPREVEQQICIRIEEALEGLEGIDELRCIASLNQGVAIIEASDSYSFESLLNSVKSRVDSVNTFPTDTERPIVEEIRVSQQVVSIAVSGDADEASIKEYTETLKDELSQLPNIPLVEIQGTRAYELAIEVSETTLRTYGLSLDSLAQIIGSNSITVAGGLIRTDSGDIQIQVREQGYTGEDFANIPVITNNDGSQIRLGDIANIIDGFTEDDLLVRFNGKPAALLNVMVTEDPDVLKTAQAVYEFVETRGATLPEGVSLDVWRDSSTSFTARLATLKRSGIGGLILVFILLLLFLRPALAFWVSLGIGISFVGTLFVLPILGGSINMITLFAFILVLGIVVDDAIIIGENIHRVQTRGTWGVKGSKLGTIEMASPVFFAVTTSIIVFIPMLYLPGDFARFMAPIATIPILALAFSLVESLLILPAHLSHLKPEKKSRFLPILQKWRSATSDALDLFLVTKYRPFLRYCLHHRAFTVSGFFSVFALIAALYIGGWVESETFPTVPIEYIDGSVDLPAGVPYADIERIAQRMEEAAYRAAEKVEQEYGENVLKEVFVLGFGSTVNSTVELTSPEERSVDSTIFADAWEIEVGEIPEAEEVTFTGSIEFGGNADIAFRLEGRTLEELQVASDWVAERLSGYEGVYNVRDSLNAGRPEMEIAPTNLAAILGGTPAVLAQQMRQVFYGQEIQRIPRFREDVRVMLRYPEEERSSTQLLDNLLIRTPDQREVPFNSLAETRFVEGYSSVTRIDGNSSITVLADFRRSGNQTAGAVVTTFLEEHSSGFHSTFPTARIALDGAQLENIEFMSELLRLGTLALIVIYGLLAIQFKSLSQPLIILIAIPFGFAGAVVGHIVTGQVLSLLSLMGVLAAAGVIVNDTLVLIDRANKLREQGFSPTHSIIQAGRDRFRPIFLTSATTFAGLTPLMLEKSTQAQFLIPMATSLSWGVLAATLVTLVLVPCIYSISEGARMKVANWRKEMVQ
jgi:multidrug efflux pump subunit AcrB|tara:strand:- start:12012 stop:15110 length:3099 start_codon:yes stop_codon:yes gene_type:complete